MIPYGRQDVHDADVQAVLKVLNSDFLTQGPQKSVKLMVSATLVGGQREKQIKTDCLCVAPQPMLLQML